MQEREAPAHDGRRSQVTDHHHSGRNGGHASGGSIGCTGADPGSIDVPDPDELLPATGRLIPAADFTGEVSIFDVLDAETFETAEDLGRFIGQFYGYRSATPTHGGAQCDGVAWWITRTILALTETDAHGWISVSWPTPDMATGWSASDVADLLATALEAAALVVLPVEQWKA